MTKTPLATPEKHGWRYGKSKYNIPEGWLREKYIGEGLSQAAIAKMAGCRQAYISILADRYGIVARPRSVTNSGPHNGRWAGGRRIDKDGYVLIWKPEHPHADGDGYVREHRLVAEAVLGRCLKPKEVVHHWGARDDNSHKNLLICEKRYHDWLHAKMRRAMRLGRGLDLSEAAAISLGMVEEGVVTVRIRATKEDQDVR